MTLLVWHCLPGKEDANHVHTVDIKMLELCHIFAINMNQNLFFLSFFWGGGGVSGNLKFHI